MKRRLVVLIAIVIGLLLIGSIVTSPAAAALDNFKITNFDVQMELGRDGEGRSTLRTTETITANFERRNENRGLERQFVKTYDGHSTSLEVESVTDEDGKDLPYHWSGDAMRIGEEDTYVFGPQTYKITYTQRDVTKHYGDTGNQEFYWDIIGVDWRVPIEQASLELTVDPQLANSIKTDLYCYVGDFGVRKTCEVNEAEGVYTLNVSGLRPRQGVTTALGFAPGTFSEYKMSTMERLLQLWVRVAILTTFLAVGIIIWAGTKMQKVKYRDSDIGTVVPEYLPPKNASVAASAAVSPGYYSTLAAQLTDLAVRRYIQIIETKPKRSFFRPAEYSIKVVKNIADLRAEEQEVLRDMFGASPKVGDELALKTLQNNTSVYMRFSDNDKKLRELMRNQYNFKHIDEEKRRWFAAFARILLVASILTLSPMLFVAWIVVFVISKTLWVLTDEGLALRRYLKGLDMYIKVAETERIKMLQSPEGAEKVAIKDPTNPAQLVKLYERVLPYAIMFRHEKEWAKRLGDYYENSNSTPGWYTGNTAFNAAMFSSMMTNFSGAVSTTSASSSSSGGSSGGGSVGGGGGGGGGGGW